MSSCLTHRGPDDSGVYLDGSVGLAHRRLSIIDLNTGRQPIFNEDESVAVIFNGEIYNYRQLKKSLISDGHRFTTETDTEVIVHLYEENGLSFVEQLQGMFAFALWDSDRERLVLARDQIGIKPLLFSHDGDTTAFASELPALLRTEIDHGGLDESALARYFAFGFIPSPDTAFSNISKLQPGEMAVVSENGLNIESYHTLSVSPISLGMEAASSVLRTQLESAVERRLQSDVSLGAFLSGGIDSSIVVGLLSQLLDQQVKTFTVGFEEDRFNESRAARKVANYHETDHTEFTITAADVRNKIPEVIERLGEPFADQSLIPTYVVARETGQNVKVALSGDGADELFSGYDRYRGEFLSRYYRTLPSSIRQQIIEPAVSCLPASRSSTTGELGRLAQKFVRGGVEDISARHFEWMRIPNENAAQAVIPDVASQGKQRLAEEHNMLGTWLPDDRQDDLSAMQAVDVQYTLPNQMLNKVDTASMYNSLEVRVPFLDTSVVEYALGLPINHKMTTRTRKRVLKNAFDDILPKEVLQRNKQGFDMPVGEWFKEELQDDFRTTVSTLETDMLDINEVMDIYQAHVKDEAEHGKFLWTVYVFAIWLRRMRRNNVL
ncbi:asparagine synthase (glutamine-hydrolysing) [Halogranum gelatinilyticum]|uniref:Putative asparagine synthetase [glutamine-hydrolyzing] n=2 Tax=Halogranum gelatinilyticum TaxID=660521 RepID=A0A1G9X6Y7_9EURY|nr:asparagine synthase (glutamine-hydrolysing) [Halogranum gelatinilyticum]